MNEELNDDDNTNQQNTNKLNYKSTFSLLTIIHTYTYTAAHKYYILFDGTYFALFSVFNLTLVNKMFRHTNKKKKELLAL